MTTANGSGGAADGNNAGGGAAGGAAGGGDKGQPAGGSNTGANGGQNGSVTGGDGANPFSGLKNADNLSLAKAKGWADLDTAIGSYRELEAKQGSAIYRPDPAKATADDWNKFYEKVGRPTTAADYKFAPTEGMPGDFKYDEGNTTMLRNISHAAGLDPRQAQVVHDGFTKAIHAAQVAKAQAEDKRVTDAHAEIVKAFGGEPDSEPYKRSLELSNRAIRNLGGDALLSELKETGVLAKDGSVRYPKIAAMLAKVGAGMFAEDTLYSGSSGTANPFAKDSENLQRQGEIIRKDSAQARQLIMAAGLDPAEWML